MSKWGSRPHWEFPALHLGADDHGEWLGVPTGTHMARPGATYTNPVPQVILVPGPNGADDHRAYLATFHAPGGAVSVYVDMTTPPVWDGDVLRSVDLDLDVVRGTAGEVWVDDEDEFANHRVTYGYPDEIVTLASASCARIETLVRTGAAPFDADTSAHWLGVLRLAGGD